MSTTTTDLAPLQPALGWRIGLWTAQALLFLGFGSAALMKLFTPIPQLAAMIPWAGDHSEIFVRVIGLVDLAGALGIVLPALTRIKPGLTVLAALGCATLQVFAIVFHISRGEAMVTPFNLVLLALSLFVLWGRNSKAPITPRS
jgi:DoxX-like family